MSILSQRKKFEEKILVTSWLVLKQLKQKEKTFILMSFFHIFNYVTEIIKYFGIINAFLKNDSLQIDESCNFHTININM